LVQTNRSGPIDARWGTGSSFGVVERRAAMTVDSKTTVREHSNSYEIFILTLTLMSLAIMVGLILPLSQAELDTLRVYDNVICVVFIGDFLYSLWGSHPRSEYFVHRRGWIDLLGSVPSLGIFPALGLLRLFRLFRLARISRMLRGQAKKDLFDDIIHNRSQYATVITLLLVMLVLVSSSLFVLQFESRSPDANITTGGDALWWAIVTITTVGYGDFYPVTALGRMMAVFTMFAGVGIIGALASILASLLVSPAPADDATEESAEAAPTPGKTASQVSVVELSPVAPESAITPSELAQTRTEMAQTRAEMAELRRQMAAMSAAGAGGSATPDG
jgi:voltage-gated potassium channel